MKVLFANRKDCLTSPGGDTVQMLKTIEFLKKNYDIEIDICLKPDDILRDKTSSIVHIFNIQTIEETLKFLKASKEAGKKVVLSTVYWDLSHHIYVHKIFQIFGVINGINNSDVLKDFFIKLISLREYVPNSRNVESFGTKKYIAKRKKVLLESDIILPNSHEELNILANELNIDKNVLAKKTYIIPNAVDINQEKNRTKYVENESDVLLKLKDFVLEVGRIEVNKNQYGIVKALYNNPEIPIVFIGRVNQNKVDIKYYNRVKEISEKRGNVYFVDQIPQETVFEFYKKAKVHVLPSFRESPGLSSLEALFFGCEIVTSSLEFCPISYYRFNEKAHICNPYDHKSIREAIIAAYNKPKNTNFDGDYFKDYSYDKVSNLMHDIYRQLTIG